MALTDSQFSSLIQAINRATAAATALTGSDISGSGTPGTLPVFSAAQVVGNSFISQSLGSLSASTITFAPTSVMSGGSSAFVFTRPNNTGQTAGANVPGFLYNGGSIEFATGAIATQYSVSLTTATYTAVGASTITNAYGLFVAAPTASTNITITNNWAAGFVGNVSIIPGTSTAGLKIVGLVGTLTDPALYFNQTAPSASNYNLAGNSTDTYLNAVTSLYTTSNNGSTTMLQNTNGFRWSMATNTSAILNYEFAIGTRTAQTASVNLPSYKITGASKTWATGALATQYFTYLSANTVAFVGASTATDVYNLFVDVPVAGTNATITNNFALGVAGHLNMVAGGIRFSDKTIDTTAGDTVTINSTAGRFRKDTTGTTMTVTNSYVTANSIIILTPIQVDVTAVTWGVVAGAGSFVVTFVAAPTANFDMNFMVFN